MKITMYYEDKNSPITIEVPDADCEIWVETDYQQRLAAAEDKSSVTRRTPQEIMDEECNKPTFNSHHRETRRHVSIDALDPQGDTLTSAADIETTLFDEDYEDLYRAIEKLKPKQRELVKKIFWEGVRTMDIAAVEGVNHSAISHRMETIYKRLKKNMGAEK